ncbi:PP2C family protein-serine/threonine phosphatase [Blastopirellula sp. JC732]|uniref:PP2C family protein-serine/threonine phosphatase n=1 Tax=Blastopirellula sediminis TaxID=2894196 RepID=A0A9X1MMJ1_9BACT|nr:PP2C family protein-serine/threonine phosphatase [Blastopirellula sediminis]MCC9607313.1 PP2C family protein-serine/threonine phosphatase [Blastopirellula sediminis]MCC9629394.1 PP2C family protein-serine/threonine phosphatase [Blastopirellula sediminis]
MTAFKFVLGLAAAFQIVSVLLALRLNAIYRRRFAWLFISGAAVLMAVGMLASLWRVWDLTNSVEFHPALWAESLATLMMAILFFAGIATIEPIFKENEEARKLAERENERLNAAVQHTMEEMMIARQIQQNFLPKSPPEAEGYDLAAISLPAEWTSGDYFDFHQTEDGKLIAVIADVSGHGVGPALLMSSARSYFREIVQHYDEPGDILARWNQIICSEIKFGDFITAWVAVIHPERHVLKFAGAGHNAWLLNGDGSAHELEGEGPPLGVMGDFPFRGSGEVSLDHGQILLMATDGIPETENLEGEQWGNERMLSVIHNRRSQPAERIVDDMVDTVSGFAGDTPRRDDVTAIVMKVA